MHVLRGGRTLPGPPAEGKECETEEVENEQDFGRQLDGLIEELFDVQLCTHYFGNPTACDC
jgi:hypothetical protein